MSYKQHGEDCMSRTDRCWRFCQTGDLDTKHKTRLRRSWSYTASLADLNEGRRDMGEVKMERQTKTNKQTCEHISDQWRRIWKQKPWDRILQRTCNLIRRVGETWETSLWSNLDWSCWRGKQEVNWRSQGCLRLQPDTVWQSASSRNTTKQRKGLRRAEARIYMSNWCVCVCDIMKLLLNKKIYTQIIHTFKGRMNYGQTNTWRIQDMRVWVVDWGPADGVHLKHIKPEQMCQNSQLLGEINITHQDN